MSVSKDPIRIGPLVLPTRVGLIHEIALDPVRERSPTLIPSPGESLVAFKNLEKTSAQRIRARLGGDTKVAALLSAWNFDPPEDHLDGFDYGWVDALITDFRGINDDLDTVAGVRGKHFTRLLARQPQVDPAKTALFALVGDGLPGFAYDGSAAAKPLVETLSSHGYDAVILAAYGDSTEERANVVRFAEMLRTFGSLPIAVASVAQIPDWRSTFAMQLRLVER